MSYFKGINESKQFERGIYFDDGLYVVEVQKTLVYASPTLGDCFIAELKVVETSNPAKHPVGSKASWLQKMQNKQVAFASIQEFLAAAKGYDFRTSAGKPKFEKEFIPNCEKLANAAIDDANALKGDKLRVQVTKKPKKNKPAEMFSLHTWSPL